MKNQPWLPPLITILAVVRTQAKPELPELNKKHVPHDKSVNSYLLLVNRHEIKINLNGNMMFYTCKQECIPVGCVPPAC